MVGSSCHSLGEPESPKPGAAYENGAAAGNGGLICQKKKLSAFFFHFGPLTPPMEGRVDFYHTNFSQRSHLRHPDFFAAEPDAEKLTF